jgi:RNase P/RNase MRP subunit POP5
LLKRVKRRYLALGVDSKELVSSSELMDAVWNAVGKLYGEYGASRTGLKLIDYDTERRFLVVRAAHTAVEMVRTALASITRIGNKPVAIQVLAVSGTIKALYKKTKP